MNQELYDLPDQWRWTNITDAARVGAARGFVPQHENGKVPFIGMSNIDQETGLNSTHELRDYEKVRKGYTKFQRNAVLLAKITPCTENNKTALIRNLKGGYATTEVLPLHPLPETDPCYLLHFLRSPSIRRLLVAKMAGATGRQRVPTEAVISLRIPLPSIDEQKRIVAKLDAIFARIDKAIFELQKNLERSRAFLASALDEVFHESRAESVSLTEVVDFIGGSQPPKSEFSKSQKDGFVRLIQIRDYKTDNHIVFVKAKSTKKFCETDDVMIGRYGPPVFQILRGLEGAYNVALMKASPNESLLSKEFLFWFLKSPAIQNYIVGLSQRAAGQSGVNKKALEKYNVPLPTLDEQRGIVVHLNALSELTRGLDAGTQERLNHLTALKASLLDSAFRGFL